MRPSYLVSAILALSLYCLASTATAASLHFQSARLAGDVPVKSWKTLRDARVVKQDLDYSCGAASLATVLSEFYGESITEDEVMHAMEGDGMTSFKDLAHVAWLYGYEGKGLALDFEKLKTLKIPAIA
ncbi:MAG: C39 family peptidase [Thiotrichales bacterium]